MIRMFIFISCKFFPTIQYFCFKLFNKLKLKITMHITLYAHFKRKIILQGHQPIKYLGHKQADTSFYYFSLLENNDNNIYQ